MNTKRISQNWFEELNPNIREAQLTEVLVLDRIPTFLDTAGPYHAVFEEARESSFLREFRSWVANQSLPKTQKELQEVKKAVEADIKRIQQDLLLKYLSKREHVYSLGQPMAQ